MAEQQRRAQLLDMGPEPAPDGGLAAIAAGFAATIGGPQPGGPPAEPAKDHPQWRAPTVPPWAVWPLDLPPQQSAVATSFDPVDYGPPTGWAWRIDEMILTLQGASQANVYREAIAPVNLRFQTTVSGLWEPRMLVLLPGKRLIVQFVGGGGVVAIEGERIRLDWLPEYLM